MEQFSPKESPNSPAFTLIGCGMRMSQIWAEFTPIYKTFRTHSDVRRPQFLRASDEVISNGLASKEPLTVSVTVMGE